MRLLLCFKSARVAILFASTLLVLNAQEAVDNHALLFDGANISHVEVNADNINSTVFSCFAWIKPVSDTPTGNLFGRWIAARCFAVRINWDYTLRALVYPNIDINQKQDPTQRKIFTSSKILRMSEWNLVGVIVDGSTAQFILNQERITVEYTEVMQPFIGNALRIGGGLNMAGTGLKGYVDEFSYWRKAVSESDIEKIIACRLTGNEDGLELYYNFEQEDINSTKKVTDLAGNSTGVVKGGVERKEIDSPKLPEVIDPRVYDYERFPGATYLNSMVAEYVNVALENPSQNFMAAPYKTYDFTLGRDNWMYFKLASDATEGSVSMTIDSASSSDPKVIVKQAVHVWDGMAFIGKGNHQVYLWTEGNPSDIKLVVRAIPELVFYKFASATSIVNHYRNNTDENQAEKSEQRTFEYLKENNLIAPYTTIASITKDRINPQEYMSEINEWRAMGRRWVIKGAIGWSENSTGEAFYQLLQTVSFSPH